MESVAIPESIHESWRRSYEVILVDPYVTGFSELKDMITDVVISTKPVQP